MRIKFTFSLILCLLSSVNAKLHVSSNQVFRSSYIAYLTCQAYLPEVVTYFSELDEVGFCNTENQAALGTFTHCIVQLNKTGSIQKFVNSCSMTNLTIQDFWNSYNNATDYMVDPATDASFNATEIYDKPIKLGQAELEHAYKSASARWININLAVYFGIILFGYWYIIMFLSGIYNYFSFVSPSFKKRLTGNYANKIRKYITLPALGGRKHMQPFVFLRFFEAILPTRLEGILVFIWFILALAFNVCRYRTIKPAVYYPKNEIPQMIAVRTGIMATYLVPSLILFSGRNNFMQWISGWHYSRFIIVHKWMARLLFILILVHAVTFNISGKIIGKYDSRNAKPFIRWGYVAFICICLLVFHTLQIFRRKRYEVFVAIHIILSAVFIAGGWIHTAGVEFEEFFYAAAAVWCFDRAVRIGRLISFGSPVARVQLIANETVKVTVKRPHYWKPFPGCHAFIHFLKPTMFWQSHPFTIIDSILEENTITFYLKVKGGITHGLYQFLAKQENQEANIRVSVEGPYGRMIPINRAENAVFFVGGNGIPGLYYEAISMSQNNKYNNRIRFYWIIRHYKSLEWFAQELDKIRDTSIELVIYVTRPDSEVPSFISESELDSLAKEKTNEEEYYKSRIASEVRHRFNYVEFREGRPDIDDIVTCEIEDANGSIAFATCAHETMVDAARKAVSQNLHLTKHHVDLFEQIQTW